MLQQVDRVARGQASSGSTISSSNSPTSTDPARPAPTRCSPRRSCAWASRRRRATSFRPTSRACPPGMRCGSPKPGIWPRAAAASDLMVAMNPQTWDQDVKSIEPGGYLFYDNTKPMPPSKFRDDIVVLGVPLTEMTNKAYTDSRQRQLFKNIVGLGALSALLDMDAAGDRAAAGRAVQGPRQADRRERAGAAHGPRLGEGRTWTARSA